ncbi:MAG: biotin--[acetyl-CoA-carboxylase] ligase [Bacteroidota bacterium]
MLFSPEKLIHLPECQSTNDIASELIAQGKGIPGLCISTDRQTAGRGQRGNTWNSAPSGLDITATFLLQPHWLPIPQQFLISMAAALAVADTAAFFTGEPSKIKWPNDVFIGNKKTAGILIENSIRGSLLDWCIIGIGLNVNGSNYPETGTSLAAETGHEINRNNALLHLAERLSHWCALAENEGRQALYPAYISRLLGFSEAFSFLDISGKAFSGIITGIAESGMLEMTVNKEFKAFGFKEITFVI